MSVRSISQIAYEIQTSWKNVYYGAVPYLSAMYHIKSIDDEHGDVMYGDDTARSVVRYFLSNATGWRGEDARRIKAELKVMIEKSQNY